MLRTRIAQPTQPHTPVYLQMASESITRVTQRLRPKASCTASKQSIAATTTAEESSVLSIVARTRNGQQRQTTPHKQFTTTTKNSRNTNTPMLPASRLMIIVVEPSVQKQRPGAAQSLTRDGKTEKAHGRNVVLQRQKRTFVLWQIPFGHIIKSHLQCDVRHCSYKRRPKTFV